MSMTDLPSKAHDDRVLLESIVRRLVSAPEAVLVRAREEADSTYLLITVAQQDAGKVIGKQGRTADAIRHLFACVGSLERRKVYIEIDDLRI